MQNIAIMLRTFLADNCREDHVHAKKNLKNADFMKLNKHQETDARSSQ